MPLVSVIGGSGFIGTRLCERLAKADVAFEIIDIKLSSSFPDATKIADIRDRAALREAVKGDVIVHLAAVHRDDVQDRAAYARTNIDGTRNVCGVAEDLGVHKIIFTSSVAVYGFAPKGTDETGKIEPFHEYGRTKFEAENVLRDWQARNSNTSLILIRPTVVFGEGNRGNVYNLLKQIASGRFVMIGAGDNLKSMAYVGNMAAFIHHGLETECKYGVFNYVDGPDYDMNTLVKEVQTVLRGSTGYGIRIPYPVGLTLGHIADLISKIISKPLPISAIRVKKFCATTSFHSSKEKLNYFKPPFTLQDGLRQTLEAEFVSPDPKQTIFFSE